MKFQVITDMSDGARIKYWVKLEDGREGVYKESKRKTDGTFTYEHISEFLATSLGMILGIPMCEVLLYENAVISISSASAPLQSFLSYSEEFSHSYHMSNLATFNISSLLNPANNKYVTEVLDMLFFDALIGNSDRHPGNFALMDNQFYPLYDNGSSLCACVNDDDIDSFLRDSMRWRSLMYTKSKAVLRDDQKLQHYELLQILKASHQQEYLRFCTRLQKLDIQLFIESIKELIPPKRQMLLTRFLTERKGWFYE